MPSRFAGSNVAPSGRGRLSGVCHAMSADEKKEMMGFDYTRGFFGFVPFSELWVGRWAMLGFASGLAVELVTGKGILRQVGLEPSPTLFIVLSVLIGGATLAATGLTGYRLATRAMSDEQVSDYANFLGLKGEGKSVKAEANRLKMEGDFTSAQDMEQLAVEARKATPADTFLSATDVAAADGEATALKAEGDMMSLDTIQTTVEISNVEAQMKNPSATPPAQSAGVAQVDSYRLRSEAAEAAYARQVEMDNGRWAMIGFALAILLEAKTGQGIVGQLIMYGKASGLLGDLSGF